MRFEDVRAAYEARYPLLEAVAANLERQVVEEVDGLPHVDRVSFRVKTPESFLRKCFDASGEPRQLEDGALRYAEPLEEIEDQIAGRVLVFFRDDLQIVETRIREAFAAAVEVVEKRPATHDAFGYESDHFVFVIGEHLKPTEWYAHEPMPVTFELQVRTLFMHAYAEPQHDIGYKAGSRLDLDVERRFAWIAASAWGADVTLNDLNRELSGRPAER